MTTSAPGARRHIFLVANNVEEFGGVQRVVHTLAEGFAARGHRVLLIGVAPGPSGVQLKPGEGYRTLTLGRGEPKPWGPQCRTDYLRPVSVAREVFRRLLHKRHVRLLRRELDAVSDGVVIVAQVWAMRWVQDAQPQHVRVVAMSHESYEAAQVRPPGTIGPSRHDRMLQLYRDVDAVVLLTETDAAKWAKEGLPNVRVMHNPLPVWPAQPSPVTSPVAVAIGRLEQEKRYDLLIEAWARVHEQHADWELRIYGDGSLRTQLQAHIEAAGLVSSVRLMGTTSDVVAALTDSSMLVLSSEQEGLPVALAEALGCGVPCVAFDCAPGIRELVWDGVDGYVVPNGDVPALAAGIVRLIEDVPTRRSFAAAARDNAGRFRVEEIIRGWEALLDGLPSSSGSA